MEFFGITQCVYKPTAILEDDFQQKALDRLAEYKSVGLQVQFINHVFDCWSTTLGLIFMDMEELSPSCEKLL